MLKTLKTLDFKLSPRTQVMSAKTNHILLTGPPGIGKTTLIKKICTTLTDNNIPVSGFYTEEIRNKFNRRDGFDVVTIEGKRERLARVQDCLQPNDPKKYRVGQYYVFPETFENLILPMFTELHGGILVLDEIGKMELFSTKFEKQVRNSFGRTELLILATVPIHRGRLPLVESLVSNPSNKVITVTEKNRNDLLDKIIFHFQI